MSQLSLAPVLTPHGHLVLRQSSDAPALEPGLAQRLLDAFARGSGHGLLQLGAEEVRTALPPVFSYWRELGDLHRHYNAAYFAFGYPVNDSREEAMQ
jgi:hypothetical protein